MHDGGWAYRHQLNVILRFLRKTQKYSIVADMLEERESLKILGDIDREEAQSLKVITAPKHIEETGLRISNTQSIMTSKPTTKGGRLRHWMDSLFE